MKKISTEELSDIMLNRGKDLELRDLDFRDIEKISEYDFSNSTITHCFFNGIIFDHCWFDKTALMDCNFSGTSFTLCNFLDNAIQSCNFYSTYFNNCIINSSGLSQSNFYLSIFIDGEIKDTLISNCNFGKTMFTRNVWDYIRIISSNFFEANLYGCDIQNEPVIDIHSIGLNMICPEEGAFIGYKKALIIGNTKRQQVIVKLQILKDSKRSSATSNKCRCDKAKVLDIYDIDNKKIKYNKATSIFSSSFVYEIGKIVKSDSFDENRWKECGQGIHFFISEALAKAY